MPLYVVRASDHDAEAVQPPNRDDLLNTGMSPAQVDHEMIRRHELEVIEASFTRWVTIFGFIVCLLLPVSMGLLIYLIWFWIAERKKECDIPMNVWFIVVIINIIYNINFNGKSIHRQASNQTPMPLRGAWAQVRAATSTGAALPPPDFRLRLRLALPWSALGQDIENVSRQGTQPLQGHVPLLNLQHCFYPLHDTVYPWALADAGLIDAARPTTISYDDCGPFCTRRHT